MKKVFAFIGSNSNNSNTEYFTRKIIKEVNKKSKEEVFFEIYNAKNTNISMCKGCKNCFVNGNCILDNNDDMRILKKKMLKSDFIIFGSPVYIHNVSGTMKNFLDRIAEWCHCMNLSGKYGIIVTTTSTNGSIYVQDYLYTVMSYMGLNVICKFNVDIDLLSNLYKDEKLQESIINVSSKILQYIDEDKTLETNLIQETIFRNYKLIYENAESKGTFESQFWNNTGMIKCNSLKEYISKK